MISEANVQALLECISNNEKAPKFYLGTWVNTCGTYGCLLGNDIIAKGRVVEKAVKSGANGPYRLNLMVSKSGGEFGCLRGDPFHLAMEEYGVGSEVASWLFNVREFEPNYHVDLGGLPRNFRMRDPDDREAAINRIRKFVYYILHKREMLYDDSGCIRETARRSEGNHMVMRQVKQAVQSKSRETVEV